MLLLDYNRQQRNIFERTLRGTYELRVRVRLLTLDEDDVSDLTERLIDGQVNIDTTADSDRSLSMSLSDPHNVLNLDSDSPDDGALYLDRMIRVNYLVWVDGLDEWASVPVFTGPIVSMGRNGDQIDVTCLGKEYLAQGATWHPLTIKKGHNTVDAIRTILRERAGETRFDFPDLKHRLTRPVSLGRMEQPWRKAQRLADVLDRQLYYDGAGVCRLRRRPKHAVFSFKDGDDGTVLSDAQVTYDLADVRNVVWLKGGKPKGSQGRNRADDDDNRDDSAALIFDDVSIEQSKIANIKTIYPNASGPPARAKQLDIAVPMTVHDPYEHIDLGGGKEIDWLTQAQLNVMQAMSKEHRTVTIVQGSYTSAVPASGGTHAGGGTIDVSPDDGDYVHTVADMRRAGFAAWHRDPSQGDWGHHIHAVSIFSKNAASGAKSQVQSYLTNTGDGLGFGPYGPRVDLWPHLRARMAQWVDIPHATNVIDDDNKPSPRDPVPDHEPKPVTAFAVAPRSHPLSPQRLGREGAPHYLVEQIERDHVRTKKDAERVAQSVLDDMLMEGVQVSFDALPIPTLEPLDKVRIATDSTSMTFVLRQFSLPLTHAGIMSVGTNRRVTPARKRIRGRHRRR